MREVEEYEINIIHFLKSIWAQIINRTTPTKSKYQLVNIIILQIWTYNFTCSLLWLAPPYICIYLNPAYSISFENWINTRPKDIILIRGNFIVAKWRQQGYGISSYVLQSTRST